MKTAKFKVALGQFFALLGVVLTDGEVSTPEFGVLVVSLVGAGLVWLVPNLTDEEREKVATEIVDAATDVAADYGYTLDGRPKRPQAGDPAV